MPKNGRGEINRIAEALRVHATVISQVLRAHKDFTLEQAELLSQYLGLRPLETDYFLLLVQKDRAGSVSLKKYFSSKLDEVRERSALVKNWIKDHRTLNDTQKAVFYSSWIYSAVRLFTSVGEGQTLERIAEKFRLSRAAASEILDFLTESGLVHETGGVFTLGSQHTHLDQGSPFLPRHHSNWRVRSIARADDLSAKELMFTSPFSISNQDFQKLREELLQMIKKSAEMIAPSPAEEIACLNIDLFWIRNS